MPALSLRLFRLSVTLISLTLLLAPASAREIYKWVAADGTIHYGESLPESAVASFEVLEVVPADPARAPDDYRSTLELADSLEAGRLARERLRLEKERLALEQRRLQEERDQWNESAPPSYVTPYAGYPRRPYRRPPYVGHYPWYPPTRPTVPQRPGPGPYQVPKRVYTPD